MPVEIDFSRNNRELRLQKVGIPIDTGATCQICGSYSKFPDYQNSYIVCCPAFILHGNDCWDMAEYLEVWSKVRGLEPVSMEYYLINTLL